jgi:predicted ATP-dependent endonuclease of OLD family
MTEKLIIKNFAGIKEVEIEIKQINILIGPQASGKSVCAKLLFYFKNFIWQILSTIENKKTKRELDSGYSKTFEEYFPSNSWGDDGFFIRYEISDVFIQINRKQGSKSKIVLTYSDFFKKKLAEFRNSWQKEKNFDSKLNYPDINRTSLINYYIMKKRLAISLRTSVGKEITSFDQLFIPAGRSFFANLQSNIFSFLSSDNTLDPFLREFGSIYENVKSGNFYVLARNREDEKKEVKNIQDEINRLIEKSLCGKYLQEKGKDYLEVTDGRRINIANSSSGQQETLPLAVILSALPLLTDTDSGFGQTVYIEEPEAHLFPNAQRSIIELIATVFNYRQENLQFFITTHSPYVLTAINNLLQAGLLYEEANQDALPKLKKIIPKYKALNTSEISAYVLENGKCKNIICPDTGLIDAKVIDSVSDDLAIEFDELLSLT